MNRKEILAKAEQCVNNPPENEDEEWRKIDGFSEYYEVSNLGRVRVLPHTIMRSNGRPQKIRARILKQPCDEWGYPQVRILGKTVKVHRLVAIAFLGDRQDGHEVRHLDGNNKNNNVTNLKYGTHQENVLDGYAYRGRIRKNQKLSEEKAAAIKQMISENITSVSISRIYNVSQQTICDIKHGRAYKRVLA